MPLYNAGHDLEGRIKRSGVPCEVYYKVPLSLVVDIDRSKKILSATQQKTVLDSVLDIVLVNTRPERRVVGVYADKQSYNAIAGIIQNDLHTYLLTEYFQNVDIQKIAAGLRLIQTDKDARRLFFRTPALNPSEDAVLKTLRDAEIDRGEVRGEIEQMGLNPETIPELVQTKIFYNVAIQSVIGVTPNFSGKADNELMDTYRQSSFDFAITRDGAEETARLAIEYDGSLHYLPNEGDDQKITRKKERKRKTDANKDEICKAAGLPLIRLTFKDLPEYPQNRSASASRGQARRSLLNLIINTIVEQRILSQGVDAAHKTAREVVSKAYEIAAARAASNRKKPLSFQEKIEILRQVAERQGSMNLSIMPDESFLALRKFGVTVNSDEAIINFMITLHVRDPDAYADVMIDQHYHLATSFDILRDMSPNSKVPLPTIEKRYEEDPSTGRPRTYRCATLDLSAPTLKSKLILESEFLSFTLIGELPFLNFDELVERCLMQDVLSKAADCLYAHKRNSDSSR